MLMSKGNLAFVVLSSAVLAADLLTALAVPEWRTTALRVGAGVSVVQFVWALRAFFRLQQKGPYTSGTSFNS
jgi:hypothetical protein